MQQETTDSFANRNLEFLNESLVHYQLTENISFYISGYMIHDLGTVQHQ